MTRKLLSYIIATLTVALQPALIRADIVTNNVDYSHDGAICEGTFVYDDAVEGQMPAVIIFHQWAGRGDYEMMRARMLAEQGYIAFVADIYTKSIRPETFEQRRALTTAYRGDRQMTRARATAALEAVRANPKVDANRIAAIGYCFGGFVALELARSGAPVKTTVSIHGNLNTPTPEDAKYIKGTVLIQHGAIDPYVPQEELEACKKELSDAGIEFEVIQYPNAVHAFTDHNAGDDPSKGAAYNPEADAKSWADLLQHLRASLM